MGKVADYIKTLPYLNLSIPLTRGQKIRERELAAELLEELIQEYKDDKNRSEEYKDDKNRSEEYKDDKNRSDLLRIKHNVCM